jgi:hypothetical protein
MTIDKYIQNNNFLKLGSECYIDLDPELISSSHPTNNDGAYWQHFDYANIFYGWNLYKNFKNECLEILTHLEQLQKNLALSANVDNRLLELFLNHKIDPANGLGLLKIVPGHIVPIHTDNRKISINIGLKNTNGFRTYFNNSIEDFWNNPDYYDMEVGNVYMLNTRVYHTVMAIKQNTEPRYVVSYNMIN